MITLVERFTRYPIVLPIPDAFSPKDLSAVAQALLDLPVAVKGTHENTNGLVRQSFRKGHQPADRVQQVAAGLADRPRPCLSRRKPREGFWLAAVGLIA
jgi:IS30 family transposase